MAILKNGSSGPKVENLQTALNKAGTKPPLKVDGIFGKLTDKATRAAQKKFGLTADGKAGELTLAALKYGGALPNMKVEDYVERTARFRKFWEDNQDSIQNLHKLQSEIASLNALWSKDIPEVDGLIGENYKQWEKIAEMCTQLVKKQKEFQALRLKDPKKAAKLASECEALDKQVEAIGAAKITPNLDKANKLISEVRKKLKNAMKSIDDLMAIVAK